MRKLLQQQHIADCYAHVTLQVRRASWRWRCRVVGLTVFFPRNSSAVQLRLLTLND